MVKVKYVLNFNMQQNERTQPETKGLVFDIKKYAIHDGPGIRTTVFFKGCPLHCRWCHNPESWKDHAELGFRMNRCVGCGQCAETCPRDAISLVGNRLVTDVEKCVLCGRCVEICEYHAPSLIEIVPGLKVAEINQALCKGCGTCASWCPTGAIEAQHFTDKQIDSMMEALLTDET